MITIDKLKQILYKTAGITEFNFFDQSIHEVPFAKIAALLDKNNVDARSFIDLYNDSIEGMMSTQDTGDTVWVPSSNLMDMTWEEFLEQYQRRGWFPVDNVRIVAGGVPSLKSVTPKTQL